MNETKEDGDTKTLRVWAEDPSKGYSHEVAVEVPADLTREQAARRAEAEFWEMVNYGFNATDFEPESNDE